MGLLDDIRESTASEPMREDAQPRRAGWLLPDDVAEGAVEAYLRQFRLELEGKIKDSKSGQPRYEWDSRTVGLVRKRTVRENFRYEFSKGGSVHTEAADSKFARKEGWWSPIDGSPLYQLNGSPNGLLEIYSKSSPSMFFVCLYEDHVEQVVRMTEERLRAEGIQAEASLNFSEDPRRLTGVSIRICVPCDSEGNV